VIDEIVLVRHAHAEWVNDEARPLSRQGRLDAERLVPLLAKTTPDALYSSPYARARQTIEPLAAHLDMPIATIEGFRERTLAADAVADFEGSMLASWQDFSLTFPGGESSFAAQARVRAAFDAVVARPPGGAPLVATHGNVLALLFNSIDASYHYDFWHSLTFPDVFRLSLESGQVVAIERLWREA
jgi:2,3-bisphosphoglycerate-dependent phosphoglycerate mutase